MLILFLTISFHIVNLPELFVLNESYNKKTFYIHDKFSLKLQWII
jgi:hypothetical protein